MVESSSFASGIGASDDGSLVAAELCATVSGADSPLG
jgi:hypothetical protein